MRDIDWIYIIWIINFQYVAPREKDDDIVFRNGINLKNILISCYSALSGGSKRD